MQLDVTIAGTLRMATALLFAAGVTHKVWQFGAFRRTVGQYLRGLGISGFGIESAAALCVVALELAIVVTCVLLGKQALAAALASSTLLLYGVAMAANLLRGNDLLDCGCHWGDDRQPVRWALVARNVFLAILALGIALPVPERAMLTIELVSIVFATLVVALLYTAANHMLVFASPARRNSR